MSHQFASFKASLNHGREYDNKIEFECAWQSPKKVAVWCQGLENARYRNIVAVGKNF